MNNFFQRNFRTSPLSCRISSFTDKNCTGIFQILSMECKDVISTGYCWTIWIIRSIFKRRKFFITFAFKYWEVAKRKIWTINYMMAMLTYGTWISLYKKWSFPLMDFLSKCDQIRSFLWIWSHLPMKSLIENFIFCAVLLTTVRGVFRTLSNMYDGVFLQNSSSFQPLTISEKSAISYVWQGSKYASDCAFFKC